MNPVIQRELIEQSRSPVLFRLRLISAGVLVGALLWGLASWEELRRNGMWAFGPWGATMSQGGFLFHRVQTVLTAIIFALAPTLTADAIARERRESTLNLLGLTPLRAGSVAIGKSAANGIRALTLWFAAIPILSIPFLLGGVSGIQLLGAATTQFILLALGLSAGLVASSLTTQFRRALALAFVLLVTFCFLTLVAHFVVTMVWGFLHFWLSTDRQNQAGFVIMPWDMFSYPPGLGGGGAAGMSSILTLSWLRSQASLLIASGLVVLAALRFAAWRVRKLWQEEPPRPQTVELQRQLTQPILFPGWIRRRQRARLSRNPLVWIQHRTVAAALARWGWIFLVMVVWMLITATGGWMGGFGSGFTMPLWFAPALLMGGMAFSAAGGFRAERENGTLELLLVTPLTTTQLLQSRWLAHAREFFLPVLLQVVLAIYVQGLWRNTGVDYSRFNWWLLTSLAALPAIGLWRGLQARNFVTAVLSTAFWGLFLPAVLTMLSSAWRNPGYFLGPASLDSGGFQFFMDTRLDWGTLPALFQLFIGVLAFFAVRRELDSRQFAHGAVGRS